MKKIISMMGVGAFVFAGAAFAAPNGGQGQGGFGGGRGPNLTDEQNACVAAYGCPEMERPQGGQQGRPEGQTGERTQGGEPGQRPERPEMSAEQRAAMEAGQECRRAAFAACGIEMPERPEGQRRQ